VIASNFPEKMKLIHHKRRFISKALTASDS